MTIENVTPIFIWEMASSLPLFGKEGLGEILQASHENYREIEGRFDQERKEKILYYDCLTLRPCSYEQRRMTRGRCGSLFLHRVTISFTTLHRF